MSPKAVLSLLVFGSFLAVLLAGSVQLAGSQTAIETNLPRQVLRAGAEGIRFVENSACAECHQEQYEEWQKSHHFHAMEPANSTSVLGNFNDTVFQQAYKSTRFFRENDKFYVNIEGPGGKPRDYQVLFTFGYFPLQQYLVELDGGRLQALTVAWDSEKEKWFSLLPGENIDSSDPLHWTARAHNWNSRCAECHSTDFRKNYDIEANSFRSEWATENVSCQSCHGPGEAHIKWAKGDRVAGSANGLVTNTQAKIEEEQIEVCARCHSRRYRISLDDKHGRPFMDDFVPSLLREDLYHADGQIDQEVYVYGSFLQSKMHQAGVTCSDCHNSHSGALVAEGNDLCARCHQEEPPKQFTTIQAKLYDSTEHHRHEPGTEGAKCVNCHMPAKTYMVTDPRRDHSFRVPRADLSLKIGTPNACIGCHSDQSNQWAQDTIVKWYGASRSEKTHYGEILAAGRSGDPGALGSLINLAANKEQPVIVRATAASLLERYGLAGMRPLVELLQDGNPLIKVAAIRGLRNAPARARVQLLAPLLEAPVRAVRISAARQLANVPSDLLTGQKEALEKALNEYIEAQNAMSETPEAHVNLGGLFTDQGRPDKAERQYKIALKLAPEFRPTYLQLASLYNSQRRNEEAEKVLKDILSKAPDFGDAHYSLGLLWAELGKLSDAEKLWPKRQLFCLGDRGFTITIALSCKS